MSCCSQRAVGGCHPEHDDEHDLNCCHCLRDVQQAGALQEVMAFRRYTRLGFEVHRLWDEPQVLQCSMFW